MATDPILAQLARLRDVYALHLARVGVAPMDPLYKQQRVTELQGAIGELDRQIVNLQKGDETP